MHTGVINATLYGQVMFPLYNIIIFLFHCNLYDYVGTYVLINYEYLTCCLSDAFYSFYIVLSCIL